MKANTRRTRRLPFLLIVLFGLFGCAPTTHQTRPGGPEIEFSNAAQSRGVSFSAADRYLYFADVIPLTKVDTDDLLRRGRIKGRTRIVNATITTHFDFFGWVLAFLTPVTSRHVEIVGERVIDSQSWD